MPDTEWMPGDLARNLVATVPRIIRFREKNGIPFIARIQRAEAKFLPGTRPGHIEMVLTEPQWRALLARGH